MVNREPYIVRSDFIQVSMGCSCDEMSQAMVPSMLRYLTLRGDKRVVLMGGCDGGGSQVNQVLSALRQEGIETIWINPNPKRLQLIEQHLFPMPLTVQTWNEAQRLNATIPALFETAMRVEKISRSIMEERSFLREYPIAQKVIGISWYASPDLQVLFGFPLHQKSEVNAVLLLQGMSGVLVTKSRSIRVVVQEPVPRAVPTTWRASLELHPTINLLIQIEAAAWKVIPHPLLDPGDPDLKYVPMWQRLVKDE